MNVALKEWAVVIEALADLPAPLSAIAHQSSVAARKRLNAA